MKAKRILVVDDDLEVNKYFAGILSGEGYAVDCAFSVAEATGLVNAGTHDLIILDYVLPDADASVFLSNAILQSGTKVLLITGHLSRHMVVSMFKLGICGYLSKPVGADERIHNVSFHLRATKQIAYAK